MTRDYQWTLIGKNLCEVRRIQRKVAHSKNSWDVWGDASQENLFYPHLSLDTVFSALKLTKNSYVNMSFLSFGDCYFNHKLSLPLPHTSHTWKINPSTWQKLKVILVINQFSWKAVSSVTVVSATTSSI